MDEQLFFRASRLGQVCDVRGGNLTKMVDKEGRERRLANLRARVAMGFGVFDDTTTTSESEEQCPRHSPRVH